MLDIFYSQNQTRQKLSYVYYYYYSTTCTCTNCIIDMCQIRCHFFDFKFLLTLLIVQYGGNRDQHGECSSSQFGLVTESLFSLTVFRVPVLPFLLYFPSRTRNSFHLQSDTPEYLTRIGCGYQCLHVPLSRRQTSNFKL